MCFGSNPTYRSREPEVRYLIHYLTPFGSFEQNVLRFDVPVDKISLVDAPETLEDLDQHPEGLVEREGFTWETGLVGQQIALVAVFQNNEYEIGGVQGGILVHDVLVFEFLHDFYLLFDVFLKKRLLLDLGFGDDFDGVELFSSFYLEEGILLRDSRTSPKAPLPIDLITS